LGVPRGTFSRGEGAELARSNELRGLRRCKTPSRVHAGAGAALDPRGVHNDPAQGEFPAPTLISQHQKFRNAGLRLGPFTPGSRHGSRLAVQIVCCSSTSRLWAQQNRENRMLQSAIPPDTTSFRTQTAVTGSFLWHVSSHDHFVLETAAQVGVGDESLFKQARACCPAFKTSRLCGTGTHWYYFPSLPANVQQCHCR